ncbi:deoxyribonuclease IV [Conexibacter sp. SYSU D00693]|uniref:deoxyribonuclease IV n=1 Tax=Conexibacter sp. SYSU D00693 TaxID=2812560 RepID=UPI00196BB1B2|nr:deoxyribonuclease IV [Conexibacter sp. SYSU D00693]
MLIGAHVSPAGGPAKAVERGAERGAQAIQIFNQNPRAWKPTVYDDAKLEAYHRAMEDSPVKALVIHAVYLLNAASEDEEIRAKTLTSLIASLEAGQALGARGVVLHPGSALGGEVGPAIERAGKTIEEALDATEGCKLLLEDTAGAGGTLGRSFEELAALLEASGGGERLGVCLDSCHLLASGYDVRDDERLTAVLDDFDRIIGMDRLGCLHLNDSQTPLGSNRDRHANVGEGELGELGCSAFLSEPRFQDLPVLLETQGPDKQGPSPEELQLCHRLREEGIRRRGG